KQDKILISEHSTLRRHSASLHMRQYRKWCDANHFDSMLLEDTRRRKEAALDSAMKTQQKVLGDHFGPPEAVIPYSDRAFEAATIEWLVHTNQACIFIVSFSFPDIFPLQPIHAFKHPTFKKMLDIASRASCGISLLSPKKTRARVIHIFKQQMFLLWSRLNVRLIIIIIE
ncbi:hypothetical protein EI94DRAFT_1623586, partial [Lactarius quietus]